MGVSFYNRYHKKNSNYNKIISRNNFTYYYQLKFLDQLFKTGEPSNVLDVGCGVGSIALYIAKEFPDSKIEGIDISSSAIRICNNAKKSSSILNAKFTQSSVERISRNHHKYDLVVCTEVIEHITDDRKFVRDLSRLLVKDGILLLSTPSRNAPLYKMGLLKNFDKEVGHLRRYTKDELIFLLQDNGFIVTEIVGIEGIFRNALFTLPLVGNIIRLIKGPFVPLFHTIDEYIVRIFGESNFIVLAKNE